MNNKVTIKDKNNSILQHVIFNDIQTQNEWLEMLSINCPFGKPEHFQLDEQGKKTDVVIPSEYSVEILDVTQELLDKKESEEAHSYLRETDYLILRELEKSLKDLDPEIKKLRNEARVKAKK